MLPNEPFIPYQMSNYPARRPESRASSRADSRANSPKSSFGLSPVSSAKDPRQPDPQFAQNSADEEHFTREMKKLLPHVGSVRLNSPAMSPALSLSSSLDSQVVTFPPAIPTRTPEFDGRPEQAQTHSTESESRRTLIQTRKDRMQAEKDAQVPHRPRTHPPDMVRHSAPAGRWWGTRRSIFIIGPPSWRSLSPRSAMDPGPAGAGSSVGWGWLTCRLGLAHMPAGAG
jgi:hypothetical protein